MNGTSIMGRPAGDARRRSRAAAVVLLLAALAPAAAGRASATEIQFHGLLDLVASGRGPAFDQNVFERGDSPFDPAGVRLFADAQLNERAQVFTDVVLHDASSLYLYGAYVVYTPAASRDLHLLAGKLPWAIGTWGPRTYSNKNPLIGTPLIYSHHTTLVWYAIPPNADQLLATTGSGAYGVDYFGFPMGRGMPIIDDSYWDVGATVAGSERPLEYALGVSAGTPSWGSTTQDDNPGKSVLGRIGLAPLPGIRFGVSGSYGPYLWGGLESRLPAGHGIDDYHQKLVMADAEWLWAHLELRAEGARNFWETPTLGELSVTGGYVEAKLASSWGGFLAGRVDELKFGDITDSTGRRLPWDSDVTRIETGAGYRISRDVTGKLVYQRSHFDREDLDQYRTLELFAAQLSIGF